MNKNLKNIIIVGIFTAVLIAGAYFTVPIGPIPVTLQVLIVLILPFVLPAGVSFLTVLFYTMLGLSGLPVFAGGGGGAEYILSPTFGFLLGMAAGAPASGLMYQKISPFFKKRAAQYGVIAGCMLLHMAVIYLLGANYMYLILNLNGTKIAYSAAWAAGVLPFVLIDLAKLIVAVPVSYLLRSALIRSRKV